MSSAKTKTPRMKSVAVFCGSSGGSNPVYGEQARLLGKSLAGMGIRLVYGGASVGLMGQLADAALEAGGQVTGVMPRFLMDKEIAHQGLSDFHVTRDMHERKLKMNQLCQGVIALPGGFGTLDECFEMLTWAQLGIHCKPIGILNTQGYFDPLLQQVARMTVEGFLKPMHRDMLIVDRDVPTLLNRMVEYTPPSGGKWVERA
jgi:hypothetical protein